MLVRVDIRSIIVAGGPIPSVVTLVPRTEMEGLAKELPIRIGVVEATSISTGVNAPDARPKTHDLLLNTIRSLRAEVLSVAVVDVRGTIFYANLLLKDASGERVSIDCRPSDGIALAVRAGVQIYVDDSVLATATMPDFAAVERERQAHDIEEFHNFVESLNPEDFASTDNE
jgi:bifunctional DNase/RNase